MSVDVLQARIRKLKNPIILDLSFDFSQIPPHILGQEPNMAAACLRFCSELLTGLKDRAAGVRVHSGMFTILGASGMETMEKILKLSTELGFYTLLDVPEFSSPVGAEIVASTVLSGKNPWYCDGVIVSPFLGSECLKPFVRQCEKRGKTLFVLARTANKTAPELQDLLTGTRLVHQVVMESVKRLGGSTVGKSSYLPVAAVMAANAPERLSKVRGQFPSVFLLLEGMDAVGGNASNCRYAFDRMGHGAAVCLSTSVLTAWQQGKSEEFVSLSAAAVENAQRKLARYFAIL